LSQNHSNIIKTNVPESFYIHIPPN
jgi:hypothetical protein